MLVGWVESYLIWLLMVNKYDKLVAIIMIFSLVDTHSLYGNTVLELLCNRLI